jgi:hypothetical protein
VGNQHTGLYYYRELQNNIISVFSRYVSLALSGTSSPRDCIK